MTVPEYLAVWVIPFPISQVDRSCLSADLPGSNGMSTMNPGIDSPYIQ